jgi:spermidine/putrescine transport system permease protein
VTLPLIAPGVVAAAMLTFALSLDDFIITYLNSGLDNTFPIQIWNMKRSKIPVQINVFSTALLIISIVLAALLVVYNNRRAQKLAGLSDS